MKLVFKILVIITLSLLSGIIIYLVFFSKEKIDENISINKYDILVKTEEKYPFVKIDSPKLTQTNHGNYYDGLGDFLFYSFDGSLGDTIINLSLMCYLEDSTIRIDKYSKIFQDDSFYYQLLMEDDTIFYFKEEKSNPENKIFMQGEYNYRFMNLLFTSDELDYYMLHKDSLSKVKGNNLPKLPKLKIR